MHLFLNSTVKTVVQNDSVLIQTISLLVPKLKRAEVKRAIMSNYNTRVSDFLKSGHQDANKVLIQAGLNRHMTKKST